MKRHAGPERWTSGNCPTGKREFHARADAKAAAKSHRHVGDHVRPYQCSECGRWHLGHMPQQVLRGVITAKEYYQ